ncbi:MAG: PH domain-containing protein [Balneolaceae bacterium]|nr:PH domain-containing protein [Balneolaceae bacterium]
MRPEPENRLTQRAVKAWRISELFRSIIFWIPVFVLWLISLEGNGPASWIIYTVAAFALVFSILSISLIPKIRWLRWHYQIDQHEIDLMHGVFIIRRTLVPVNRVQHVDTRQGPILRKFGLADVTISTAATTHEIPALDSETADRVRNQISNFARLSKEDV